MPLKGKKVEDNKRIKAAIPTIKLLQNKKSIVILLTHLGRPEGKVVENLRTKILVKELEKFLKKPVVYINDCTGSFTKQVIAKLKPGDVCLLENVRFYKEEEENDDKFSKKLAELADVYVDDAFGATHRTHASVVGVTKFLPSYAGLLMEKEITALSELTKNPSRPFVVLLGGVKVSDKIEVINNLANAEAKIRLPGGLLNVRWDKTVNNVFINGPATFLYTGQFTLDPVLVCKPITKR